MSPDSLWFSIRRIVLSNIAILDSAFVSKLVGMLFSTCGPLSFSEIWIPYLCEKMGVQHRRMFVKGLLDKNMEVKDVG